MLKIGDKVIVRDGSGLDGVEGIVYRIGDGKISVMLEREVIWHVDSCNLENVGSLGLNKLPAI